MLKVVTAKEMQEIDRVTIEEYGIAGTILMERAGLVVAEKIKELFYQNTEHRTQTTDNGKRLLSSVVVVITAGMGWLLQGFCIIRGMMSGSFSQQSLRI